ncbi:MAG: hypothetical protein B7Z73_06370 [Planctomycetia bacterium 21-64-5]|nr:MAG: hypothetical protein B7Z73_06370 [Planctomycetia bacterium 21-64-5]
MEVLWALLNSPVANAYAFAHLGKRDNIPGDMRKIPVPHGTAFEDIEKAARDYLHAAAARAQVNELYQLMLRVDAAVLRQYALPAGLEHRVLSLFTGWERVGVPFKQVRYFPPEISHPIRFADFLVYEADWPSRNRRRGHLVDKEIAGTITSDEARELTGLQAYADYYIEKTSPRPTRILKELEDRVFGTAAAGKKGA